ncbi:MAG: glycosyltransferase [Alphaproteobacteria bacterium]
MASADARPSPSAPPLVAVIPAFRPDPRLVGLVHDLVSRDEFATVLVVDDGSGADFAAIFADAEAAGATVLHQPGNTGKGAALKAGFAAAAESHLDLAGVVTVDADGQHLPDDVIAVSRAFRDGAAPLTVGVRRIGPPMPPRSLLGNHATRHLMCIFWGRRLTDTQSGLRAIAAPLLRPLSELRTGRYAFELRMLIYVIARGLPVAEVPITTVYHDSNLASHFRPVVDSLRIYAVLLSVLLLIVVCGALEHVAFAAFVQVQDTITALVLAKLLQFGGFAEGHRRLVGGRQRPRDALWLAGVYVLSSIPFLILLWQVSMAPTAANLVAELLLVPVYMLAYRLFLPRRRVPL